jgi:3-oxoacyl-[acyl-carrier-protein] synthase III
VGSRSGSAEGVAAVLRGLGGCVPDREVTNDELAARLGTTPDWIWQRTGIRARRVIAPGGATSDLAVEAGRLALAAAGTATADIVVLATSTPDHISPATAPAVAARLGLGERPAFDVNCGCSGFVYGLAAATGLIRAGIARSVLLIGADTVSTLVDPLDLGVAILFGDGAGAVMLSAGAPGEPGAIDCFDLGGDGASRSFAIVQNGGSRQRSHGPRPSAETGDYLRLDGIQLFKHAVRRMSRSVADVLDRAGWTADDLAALAPHQANQRILQAVAQELGFPPDRVLSNIDRVGNTSGASIPLLLADAWQQGRLAAGDRLVLTAFGGGFAWGSAALTWPVLTPPAERPVRKELP